MGKPFEIAAAGAADVGSPKVAHQQEGDEGSGHVDRLAAFV